MDTKIFRGTVKMFEDNVFFFYYGMREGGIWEQMTHFNYNIKHTLYFSSDSGTLLQQS